MQFQVPNIAKRGICGCGKETSLYRGGGCLSATSSMGIKIWELLHMLVCANGL